MAMLGHSVPGRPHLMIHRDPEDAEHEIWVDKYRGTESHNDPGWVIVCSREGCCCTYDMESELFDLAMCPRHSATAIDDQPEHPFGRRDGHVNKRCFLCADEELERSRVKRVEDGPIIQHPRLPLDRFYAFYMGVYLGEYRPRVKGGIVNDHRWLMGIAIDWCMSGPQHVGQTLRCCRGHSGTLFYIHCRESSIYLFARHTAK